LALRGGNETRVLSRNAKDFGSKFPEVKDSVAALDVRDAIIDYAACGIIDAMPYPVLRRTEQGFSSCEALFGTA
jgi:ATP-dependent DNA ligase